MRGGRSAVGLLVQVAYLEDARVHVDPAVEGLELVELGDFVLLGGIDFAGVVLLDDEHALGHDGGGVRDADDLCLELCDGV